MDAEHVRLSARLDENGSVGAVLRTDGVLLEENTTVGVSAEEIDPAELSAEEKEELWAARERYEAMMRRPQFRGGQFRRALPAEPQPGSEVRILAAELFDDGLIVHLSYDETEEDSEAAEWGEPPETFDQRAGIRVEDDLGTDFHESGGTAGGIQVIHGTLAFAPAVPPQARALRVTSHGGKVELFL
jgi:hypothetical protein